MVERLTFLQLDPTAAVAPSADLVAWTRLGNAYQPAHLQQALERDRTLFEHRGQAVETEPALAMVRPMADLGLYLADMARLAVRTGGRLEWLDANDGFRRRVLDQLGESGAAVVTRHPRHCRGAVGIDRAGPTTATSPRCSSSSPPAARSPSPVAAAGTASGTWPTGSTRPATPVVPADEARPIRDEKRLRSLGVARPQIVGDAGVPVEIEGTAGPWRVDPEATADGFEGRTAVLSPFDRLIHDRVRAVELFDFEYTLEMYKPKDKRRWGYFALPVLHHDRLVGKVDATADRKARGSTCTPSTTTSRSPAP